MYCLLPQHVSIFGSHLLWRSPPREAILDLPLSPVSLVVSLASRFLFTLNLLGMKTMWSKRNKRGGACLYALLHFVWDSVRYVGMVVHWPWVTPVGAVLPKSGEHCSCSPKFSPNWRAEKRHFSILTHQIRDFSKIRSQMRMLLEIIFLFYNYLTRGWLKW
jgi:hypothetical protein